jgi:hypothetical protein
MTTAKNTKATATNVAFTAVAKTDQAQARNLWGLGDAIAQEIAEAVANGAKAYGFATKVIAPRLAELSGLTVGYAEKKISLARSMRSNFETADLAVAGATVVKEKATPAPKPVERFSAKKVVAEMELEFNDNQLEKIYVELAKKFAK